VISDNEKVYYSQTALAAAKMADVATKKKSMNVVSNNTVNSLGKSKMSDVCGVQSNNGLIDLDHNGLNNASNNKLITMCSPTDDEEEEDDLILTNNTRNELDSQEDKSLQELIESELALRICATSGNSDDTDEDELSDMVMPQPEITKKIILEPRRDTIDVNAEFIVNEIEHYTLIGEPYEYSNGYLSPEPNEISGIVDPVEINIANEKQNEELFNEEAQTIDTDIITTEKLEQNELKNQNQLLQGDEDQALSVNTHSDFCILEETTDDDSSKEMSHESVISANKYLQEDKLIESNDNSDNLFSIEEQPQMYENSTHEDIQDNLDEDDNSARINDIVSSYGECDIRLKKNAEYSESLSTVILSEQGVKTNQANIQQDKQKNIDAVDEAFDKNGPISLKEASGVDEKACSFYSTEAEGPGNFVDNDDNDENPDHSVYNQSTVDVTDYKLKADFNNQKDSWMTVEEAVKDSLSDVVIIQGDESLQDRTNEYSENFYSQEGHFENYLEKSKLEDENKEIAPLATPDEISDISNACDDVSLALLVNNNNNLMLLKRTEI
jgi:hypothetical protein